MSSPFLHKKNQRPVKNLVKYMIDISMGMHYIAERGLVHRVSSLHNSEYLKLIDSDYGVSVARHEWNWSLHLASMLVSLLL